MDNSRTYIMDAVNHRQPKKVPVDFGGMPATGIHCSLVEKLRNHFGLEKKTVKAYEPFQMLGLIESDLITAMELDAVPVMPVSTNFGNQMQNWKEWKTPWKQIVLIPEDMELDKLEDGGYVVYPQGDRSVPPSAKMPESGFFFDALERQEEYDEDNPNPKDNAADFKVLSDETISKISENAQIARKTGKATVFTMPGGSLSSPSQFFGMAAKKTKGMRNLADWYMAMAAMPEFVKEVFRIQSDIAIQNLEKIASATAGDIDILALCTGDYGTQRNTFFSVDTFKDIFCPYHKKMNNWIHQNTTWKVFKHCCGSIEPLLEPMIDAEFDIMNPIQCSAEGMDPQHLKNKFGDRLTFWGGGVDTQKTLPFGTPEEVRIQVLERCRTFSTGGGFVFNAIHNVQALTPLENVIAMLNAVKEFNSAGK